MKPFKCLCNSYLAKEVGNTTTDLCYVKLQYKVSLNLKLIGRNVLESNIPVVIYLNVAGLLSFSAFTCTLIIRYNSEYNEHILNFIEVM